MGHPPRPSAAQIPGGKLRPEVDLQVPAEVRPRPLVCLTHGLKALLPKLCQAFKANTDREHSGSRHLLKSSEVPVTS